MRSRPTSHYSSAGVTVGKEHGHHDVPTRTSDEHRRAEITLGNRVLGPNTMKKLNRAEGCPFSWRATQLRHQPATAIAVSDNTVVCNTAGTDTLSQKQHRRKLDSTQSRRNL
jgi:hypothetical protein